MLRNRHFIDLADFSSEEVVGLLKLARELKLQRKEGATAMPLAGKTLAMIFQKPSNRTRLSFDVGMSQLGGRAIYIAGHEVGMGEREPIADVSRVMSRYVDAVMIRSNYHSDVIEFSEYSSVPVINGLSDLEHPCQALADLLTVQERFGKLDGIRIAYIGDANNVCNSLITICKLLNVKITVVCPRGYEPSGKERLAACAVTHNPQEGLVDAHVVYTDTWVSMGQEEEVARRRRAFRGFTVTRDLMKRAHPDAIFMHCLPAHKGEEVEPEVFEGTQSVVFDQAENRLHAQKAVLKALLS